MTDSRPDTYAHIHRVQMYMQWLVIELLDRMANHDQSKLREPELEVFDKATAQLATLDHGTPEYSAALAAMGPGLRHHYRHNSHHPEHYQDGITGMDMMDLLEMLCDWKAAGERHTSQINSLERSIEVNQARFGYSDDIKRLLLNTASQLPSGDKLPDGSLSS